MPLVGDAVDTILDRLRDAGAVGTPRRLVRDVLTETQRIINAFEGHVLDEAVLMTVANKQVYKLSVDLPNAAKVLRVAENDRDLSEVDWRTLVQFDRNWHSLTGTQFDAWAPVGRDLLVIHPAKTSASSVVVTSTKITVALVDDGLATELDDEEILPAIDLAVAVLLIRLRIFDPVRPIAERFAARFQTRVRT